MKIQKKNFFGRGGGVGRGSGWGGQGGCVWRSEAFVKIQKKKKFGGRGLGGWVGGGGGGGWGGGGVGLGGQGGWERRIEAFVKIIIFFFFFWGGGGGGGGGVGRGVRVDGNGEVKFL